MKSVNNENTNNGFSRGNSDNTNNGFSRAVQTWKTKFFYLNKRLFRVVQINGAVQLSRSVVQWWLSGAIQIIITKIYTNVYLDFVFII